MSIASDTLRRQVEQKIHDDRVEAITQDVEIALAESFRQHGAVTPEYRKFVLVSIIHRLTQSLILPIILLLAVATVEAGPTVRTGRPGYRSGSGRFIRPPVSDWNDSFNRQPMWFEPMMRDYLYRTYNINPAPDAGYYTPAGPSVIINPYVNGGLGGPTVIINPYCR